MKRFFALTLAVAAALTFTACSKSGTSAESTTRAETFPVQTAPVILPEDLTDKTLERGSVTDGVYHNDFSGLTVTFNDTWSVSDDEALAEISGCTVEDMASDKFLSTIAGREKTYDFSAYSELLDVEVNVYFENMLSYSDKFLTDEEYAEQFISDLPNTEATATKVLENTTVMIGGYEYHKVVCSAHVLSMTVTQAHYFRTVDGIACGISVVYSDAGVIAQVEEMFS